MRATSGGRSDLSRSQSLRSVCVTVCLHWRVVKERLCLFLLWFTGIFSSGGTYHATVGRGPISTCALASQVPHRVWYRLPPTALRRVSVCHATNRPTQHGQDQEIYPNFIHGRDQEAHGTHLRLVRLADAHCRYPSRERVPD